MQAAQDPETMCRPAGSVQPTMTGVQPPAGSTGRATSFRGRDSRWLDAVGHQAVWISFGFRNR